jgi:hypothetical protein
MSKKLMLLAVGALTALAFTALPGAASAGEWEHHCTSTAGVAEPCVLSVAGGGAELINDAGERISCTAVSGTGSAVTTGTTGSVKLTFTGCKETVTFFRFSCTSNGTSGVIETNTLTTHNIYIEEATAAATTPGLLLTGVNTTFTCAGFSDKTVTGNIIGHLTNPNCSSATTSMGISFDKHSSIVGTQKYEQVTTTGTVFDLTSGPHEADGTTSAQTGTGTISTKSGQHIRLTCHV